jgi:hypothetical protein
MWTPSQVQRSYCGAEQGLAEERVAYALTGPLGIGSCRGTVAEMQQQCDGDACGNNASFYINAYVNQDQSHAEPLRVLGPLAIKCPFCEHKCHSARECSQNVVDSESVTPFAFSSSIPRLGCSQMERFVLMYRV